jgi:hypothetical protein
MLRKHFYIAKWGYFKVEFNQEHKLCFYVVKKANKLNHTHEKNIYTIHCNSNRYIISCNGEKEG